MSRCTIPKLFLSALLLAAAADAYTCTNASAPSVTFVDSASAYGGYSDFASGSWLEIKGSNLADPNDPRIASGTGEWAQSDFNGANAPTNLDGISATVNGKPAYVSYISPGQINVQAPQDSATGFIMVTVTNCHATSSSIAFTKQNLAPGLLAPPNYSVDGRQYLVATFASDAAYVLSTNAGESFGLNSRPAKPGDVILFYGVGFGPVSPTIAPGIIVTENNQLTNPVTVSFGSTQAGISYQGLAPEFVGLYELYVTVPQGLTSGDYPILVTQNGVQLPQATFYLTIQSSGAAPMVQSVTLSPSSVAGGIGVTGTVTLTAAAPTGGATVLLSSNSTAVSVPGSVVVPAGATSATFNVSTSAVTANTNATITATYAGGSASAVLSVVTSGGGSLPSFNLLDATPSVTSSNQPNLTFSFDIGGAGCSLSGTTESNNYQSGFTFGAVWSGYSVSGTTITCTGLQMNSNSSMTTFSDQSAQWTSATLTFTATPQGSFNGTMSNGTLKLSSSLATVTVAFAGTYGLE